MSKLPIVSGKDMIKVLTNKELKKGTLKNILKRSDLTVDDLIKLL